MISSHKGLSVYHGVPLVYSVGKKSLGAVEQFVGVRVNSDCR